MVSSPPVSRLAGCSTRQFADRLQPAIFEKFATWSDKSEPPGPIGVHTANKIPGVRRIHGGRREAIFSPQIYPLAPGAIF
jgi:hypothetical protein